MEKVPVQKKSSQADPKVKRSVDENESMSPLVESLIIGGGGGLLGCTGLALGIVVIQAVNGRPRIDKRQVLWTFASFMISSVLISVVAVGLLGFAASSVVSADQVFPLVMSSLLISGLGSFVSGGAAGLAWYLTDPDQKPRDRAEARIFKPTAPNLAMAF